MHISGVIAISIGFLFIGIWAGRELEAYIWRINAEDDKPIISGGHIYKIEKLPKIKDEPDVVWRRE